MQLLFFSFQQGLRLEVKDRLQYRSCNWTPEISLHAYLRPLFQRKMRVSGNGKPLYTSDSGSASLETHEGFAHIMHEYLSQEKIPSMKSFCTSLQIIFRIQCNRIAHMSLECRSQHRPIERDRNMPVSFPDISNYHFAGTHPRSLAIEVFELSLKH